MLGKEQRKSLLQRNWVDIMNQDSNRSQTWQRLRDKAIRAMDDLILLAKKLPDEEQQEIFDNKIKAFCSSILRTNKIEMIPTNLQYAHNRLDYRRTRLAAILVKEALDLCVYQHQLLFSDMPTQNKLTIEQLERTQNICDELAYKLHIRKLEEDSREENLIYLFEWNELRKTRKHRERFADFLREVTASVTLDIVDLKFTKDTVTCNFTMDAGYPGIASMKRNDENASATLSIKDEFRDKVYNFQLLIKNEQNRLDLYLKEKNHSVEKKRRHGSKLHLQKKRY
jgi:hypothetical protein